MTTNLIACACGGILDVAILSLTFTSLSGAWLWLKGCFRRQ